MTEGQQGLVDVWVAAATEGLSTDITASAAATSVARLTSAPIDAAQQVVKTVLGEEAYQKYREFIAGPNTAAREIVSTLAGNVY